MDYLIRKMQQGQHEQSKKIARTPIVFKRSGKGKNSVNWKPVQMKSVDFSIKTNPVLNRGRNANVMGSLE